MGSSRNMLQLSSSIVLLGAVAHAAPNPILPPHQALDFFKERKHSLSEEHEGPEELPEDIPVPNCSPSAALLKVGDWMYYPNEKASNTADVWFTILDASIYNWNTGKAACEKLDKNMQIASIMNDGENKAVAKLPSKEDHKPWLGGYYDASAKNYYWLYGGKNVNEKMSYTKWYSGYPSYDPSRAVKFDKAKKAWRDSDETSSRPVICMMRCQTNYWQK